MNTPYDLVIRHGTLADLEALVHGNQALAHETEGKELDTPTVRQGVMAVLQSPEKGFYLVAEVEGEVVGSLMVTSEWSDWRNGEMWWLQSVYVLPGYRRMGIFQRLYAYVYQRLMPEMGVRALRLYVERDNAVAKRVYAGLGMAHSHYEMWEVAGPGVE